MMPSTDNPQLSRQLHPWIYRTIFVLAVILIFAAWGFFEEFPSDLRQGAVFRRKAAVPCAVRRLPRREWYRRRSRPQCD